MLVILHYRGGIIMGDGLMVFKENKMKMKCGGWMGPTVIAHHTSTTLTFTLCAYLTKPVICDCDLISIVDRCSDQWSSLLPFCALSTLFLWPFSFVSFYFFVEYLNVFFFSHIHDLPAFTTRPKHAWLDPISFKIMLLLFFSLNYFLCFLCLH